MSEWKSLSRVGLFVTPWTIQYSLWNSPGQNPAVGSLSLLQGIFPTQGSNPGLPHYRRILYQLNHKESPRNEYTSVKTLLFLREEGKGIFKTKLRVAVINGGKQQVGITKIHIQGAGSENVKLSHF